MRTTVQYRYLRVSSPIVHYYSCEHMSSSSTYPVKRPNARAILKSPSPQAYYCICLRNTSIFLFTGQDPPKRETAKVSTVPPSPQVPQVQHLEPLGPRCELAELGASWRYWHIAICCTGASSPDLIHQPMYIPNNGRTQTVQACMELGVCHALVIHL